MAERGRRRFVRLNGDEVPEVVRDRQRKSRRTPLDTIRAVERTFPVEEPRLEKQASEIARESRRWLRKRRQRPEE